MHEIASAYGICTMYETPVLALGLRICKGNSTLQNILGGILVQRGGGQLREIHP